MAFKRSAVRSRLSPPKTDHEAKPCGLFPYKNENRTPTGYKDKSRLQFRHGIVVGFYPSRHCYICLVCPTFFVGNGNSFPDAFQLLL